MASIGLQKRTLGVSEAISVKIPQPHERSQGMAWRTPFACLPAFPLCGDDFALDMNYFVPTPQDAADGRKWPFLTIQCMLGVFRNAGG